MDWQSAKLEELIGLTMERVNQEPMGSGEWDYERDGAWRGESNGYYSESVDFEKLV